MIDGKDYPNLTSLMDCCLFQQAAESFEDAVRDWRMSGPDSVRAALGEIERLLGDGHSEPEIRGYVSRHSDYMVDDSGAATLSRIADVLRESRVSD